MTEDKTRNKPKPMIENMRRNMRRVFWVFFLLFLLAAGYLVKLAVFDAREIASNSYNYRLRAENNDRHPGMILDWKGRVLAESVDGGNGGFTREYPYGRIFAHVVGTRRTRTGLEAKYNFDLQQLDSELMQRIDELTSGKPLVGNTIVTTFDAALQKAAYEALAGRKGAVVAIEPSTGRVLAMVSAPDFPLDASSEDWDALVAADENSPLLNRAAQGLYAPGSTFKIITAAAALEQGKGDFTMTCTGSAAFGEYTMRCFDSKAHGEVNLDKAMAQSCNVYFATLGQELGAAALRDMAERFGFNRPTNFPLESKPSAFAMTDGARVDEVIETSIGQGKTLAAPLQMAMTAATVANGGLMMRPYVLDSIQTRDLKVLEKAMPKSFERIVSQEVAARLNELMVNVISAGTGSAAQIPGVTVAGKTGTAQNETGRDHSWFVGYAPAEYPEIVVAVILEETGGGTEATRLGGKVMRAWLERE